MEQTEDRLAVSLKTLKEALKSLENVLDDSFSDVVRDATIQRFEYTFELCWKTIKTFAQFEGVDCNSPRQCIKAGFRMGWIETPDRWFEMLEARNLTVHTYKEDIANEVYELAKCFPDMVNYLIKKLEDTREKEE